MAQREVSSNFTTVDAEQGYYVNGAALFPVNSELGITQLIQGTSASPITLTAATSATLFKVREAAITYGTADTLTDLLSDYVKINITGQGNANLSPVCSAQRLYIGTAGVSGGGKVSEAYGVQTWVQKKGTGTVDTLCGHSIVVDIGADNFTASSRVQGLNVTLNGSAIVGTGAVKGISIDIKSGVAAASGISINCQTNTTTGVDITGSPVNEISFSSGLVVITGAATTRAAMEALPGASAAPVGSIGVATGAVSTTKPNFYVKVTSTTWERVVSQNAD